MGPYASENVKTLLLQIAAISFQTCPEFSSQWPSQNYVKKLHVESLYLVKELLGHMLLLNINGKLYMGSPITLSHLIFSYLER